jgi:BlaI family penicillinase repressor
MPKALPPLGDLEHEIAQLIWTGGAMTAAAVRKRLPRPLKDPTIRTVLRRLEEKGYLTHTVEAGTFMYRAKETREQIAVKAVKRIIDSFCDGSVEQMLMGMVKGAMLNPRQLKAIAAKMKSRAKS